MVLGEVIANSLMTYIISYSFSSCSTHSLKCLHFNFNVSILINSANNEPEFTLWYSGISSMILCEGDVFLLSLINSGLLLYGLCANWF